LRDNKAYIDISDISSVGSSKIRPGFFPIFYMLEDGIAKSVFKSMLFIHAVPVETKETEPVALPTCEP
jgi:hypothetical protein